MYQCFQGIVEGLVLESISQLFHENHQTNLDALEEETERLTMKSLMSDLLKGFTKYDHTNTFKLKIMSVSPCH